MTAGQRLYCPDVPRYTYYIEQFLEHVSPYNNSDKSFLPVLVEYLTNFYFCTLTERSYILEPELSSKGTVVVFFAMPSPARKVLITAAVEGLILQPLSSKREQRPAAPVKLKYGDASISNVTRDDSPNPSSKSNASFESFGIVGQCHTHILGRTDFRRGREKKYQTR